MVMAEALARIDFRNPTDYEAALFNARAAAARLRFTWDATDPGVITWRNELAAGDGSWFLIEEYRTVPAIVSVPPAGSSPAQQSRTSGPLAGNGG